MLQVHRGIHNGGMSQEVPVDSIGTGPQGVGASLRGAGATTMQCCHYLVHRSVGVGVTSYMDRAAMHSRVNSCTLQGKARIAHGHSVASLQFAALLADSLHW